MKCPNCDYEYNENEDLLLLTAQGYTLSIYRKTIDVVICPECRILFALNL